MAGIIKTKISLGVSGAEPFEVEFAASATKWSGARHMTLPDAVTDQSLIDIGGGGVTTVNAFALVADQAISVKLGAAGSNVALALAAGAPLCMAGLSLTSLSLSNASGLTAQVDYVVAGS